jgi:hypothetical protein
MPRSGQAVKQFDLRLQRRTLGRIPWSVRTKLVTWKPTEVTLHWLAISVEGSPPQATDSFALAILSSSLLCPARSTGGIMKRHRTGLALVGLIAALLHPLAAQSPGKPFPLIIAGLGRGHYGYRCPICTDGYYNSGWTGTVALTLPPRAWIRPWVGATRSSNQFERYATLGAGLIALHRRTGVFARVSGGMAFRSSYDDVMVQSPRSRPYWRTRRSAAVSAGLGVVIPVRSAVRPVLWGAYDRSLGSRLGTDHYRMWSGGIGIAWVR